MFEPIPSPLPEEFRSVQLVALMYVGLCLTVTFVIVYTWGRIGMTVPVLAVVGAILFPAFWSLIRRYYPERPDS